MMNERQADLALKIIAGQATPAERSELDCAFAANPELKKEFEQFSASANTAREILPVVAALEATDGEFPQYARERLQTKVRETLGRPPVPEHKWTWAWRLFLLVAPVTAVVVLFFVLLMPAKGPVIQVAMLDIIGQTRGQGISEVEILQNQWKAAKVQVFSNAQDLTPWEKSWPETKAPVAKVIFDPAAAEVRVLVRSGTNEIRRVIAVEQNYLTALRQADSFIKEYTAR